MFVLSFIEGYNMKRISEKKEAKNFLTFILSFTGFLISVAGYFISSCFSGETIVLKEQASLFSNWVFYLALLSEIFGLFLARKNYEVNGCNMTAINFSLFFSLSIVPIYSLFFSDFYGFSETLKINYESNNEFIMFVLGMTLLTVLYFYDKIKGKINHIYWLIPYPLILSNSMFVTGNLMQQYNGFFVYGCIALTLSVCFLFLSIKNKEIKNLNKNHAKLAGLLIVGWSIAIPANTIAVKILAIEFINILKRLCQILTGTILDKIYGNVSNKHWKDKYIILTKIHTLMTILKGKV